MKKTISFCIGFAMGITLSSLWTEYDRVITYNANNKRERTFETDSFIKNFQGSKTYENRVVQEKVVEFRDKHIHHDNTVVADELSRKVKIMCIVLIQSQEFANLKHVNAVWGKRCSALIFAARDKDDSIPVVGLNISDGKQHYTRKSMVAFGYSYDNFYNQADWFLIGRDDAYYIMENLRFLLAEEDSNQPIYFGHQDSEEPAENDYMGKGDFVLSKGALKTLVEEGLRGKQYCMNEVAGNDVHHDIPKCLQKLGVKAGRSKDNYGKTLFNSFNPRKETPTQHGSLDSVSDRAISFHYLSRAYLYVLEYYMYHFRPYGLILEHETVSVDQKSAK